ncbi:MULTISPECIES: argininosuccinate lyase [unclassified Ruegeria]|uniref:argininosuccinate lyase n=1 Tax=unclassified Ruegeria TaxID=2625375 RepID=UPI001AE480BA|nr:MULTISPECIES: argininosuccinate lyase [unclassified Ruegeria]
MTTALRAILITVSGLVLAGCGADGEPEQPIAPQPTVSATIGVGSSGAYVGGGVGLSRGPLGIYLGF